VRRVRRLTAAGVAVLLLTSTASDGELRAQEDDGSFERDVSNSGGESGGGGGDTDTGAGTPTRVPCRWSGLGTSQEDVDVMNTIYPVLVDVVNSILGGEYLVFDSTFYAESGLLHQWSGTRNRFERYQVANCSGATELTDEELLGYRWIGVTEPSPTILVPDVLLTVRGQIPVPEPAINPPTEAAINLGLWLAVDGAGPIVAEGRLGPLWARGTATLASTTFDPGNGDAPVTCSGGGTPLAAGSDIVEEGPCGYTYTSLGDANAGDLAITVTSHWDITWETSDGATSGGSVETISLSTSVPYNVYEIQTVGGD